MKKLTQAEFDAMERDKSGCLYVPANTDCTEVDFKGAGRVIFGDYCELGGCCELGDYCTLGDYCKLGDYCTLGNIVSESRTAYFYIDCDGRLFVRAGCWFSGMDDFKARVKSVHGGTLCEAQYMAACQYAETVLPLMLGGSMSTLDC